MKAIGRYDVYICDHEACKVFSLGWDRPDNGMSKIVFGVHPNIVKYVVIRIEEWHYCSTHVVRYKQLLFTILEEAIGIEGLRGVCSDSELRDGFGCWISIIDPAGECTANFQLPYEVFEKIYISFKERIRVPVPISNLP